VGAVGEGEQGEEKLMSFFTKEDFRFDYETECYEVMLGEIAELANDKLRRHFEDAKGLFQMETPTEKPGDLVERRSIVDTLMNEIERMEKVVAMKTDAERSLEILKKMRRTRNPILVHCLLEAVAALELYAGNWKKSAALAADKGYTAATKLKDIRVALEQIILDEE
jgi:hypothetical protein